MKDRWLWIEDLYHRALELEESARRDFVRRECAGDAGLKSEVETLLRNGGDTRFMATPAFGRDSSAMQPGTRLGHHVIVSAIGKGGMGEPEIGNLGAGGADFSPDGRWLAYRSNLGGLHIQLQPFPPTEAVDDTALEESGSHPMWSRDGNELFYRRPRPDLARAEGTQLVVVDVTLGGGPRFTNERILPIEGFQHF
jgi:hypothetical protein